MFRKRNQTDVSEKARLHYKKLKYKTEIAMKNYRKQVDSQITDILTETGQFKESMIQRNNEVAEMNKELGEQFENFEL